MTNNNRKTILGANVDQLIINAPLSFLLAFFLVLLAIIFFVSLYPSSSSSICSFYFLSSFFLFNHPPFISHPFYLANVSSFSDF
jgi:hypothetical protein